MRVRLRYKVRELDIYKLCMSEYGVMQPNAMKLEHHTRHDTELFTQRVGLCGIKDRIKIGNTKTLRSKKSTL